MSTPFVTSLAPANAKISGGYASSGMIDPSEWADEVFHNKHIPGAWLCCYLLRRFGWPNSGSDDYKNLCSWMLTTPISGLYLLVTPYLGDSNLHFGVRFTKQVGNLLKADPKRDAYWNRLNDAVQRWWKQSGSKLYTLGTGLREGDEDELVFKLEERDPEEGESSKVFGLWKRTERHTWPNTISKGCEWVFVEFIKTRHPNFRLPKMTKREHVRRATKFQLSAKAAIKATLRDLIKPTYVRDIYFNPFGRTEPNNPVKYFVGAGHTPEYWFKHATKAEREGKDT